MKIEKLATGPYAVTREMLQRELADLEGATESQGAGVPAVEKRNLLDRVRGGLEGLVPDIRQELSDPHQVTRDKLIRDREAE